MSQSSGKLRLLFLVVLAVLVTTPAWSKAKLTPTIEFSGKCKDKLPYGEGTLKVVYSSNKRDYGYLTGIFDGNKITNAKMSAFQLLEDFTGDFEYQIEYNKKTKECKLIIKLIDGKIGDANVKNLPEITYIQIDKEKPEPSFSSCEVTSSGNNKAFNWSDEIGNKNVTSVYSFGKVYINNPEPWYRRTEGDKIMKIGLTPKGYLIGDDFKVFGNNDKFSISSSNGTEIDFVVDNSRKFPKIKINLKDGASITCIKAKEDNQPFSTPKIESEWSVRFPNNGTYTGTLVSIAGMDPKELLVHYRNLNINRYIKLIKKIENSQVSDVALYDGVMRTPDGKSVAYYKGQSEDEMNSIISQQPLILEVKKAGTLLSVIPLDELRSVQNLAIVGYLDDNDLKIISDEAKNLVKLDLSLAYTMLSDETNSKRKAENEALAAMFGMMGAIADAQYNDYQMSTIDHAYVRNFTDMVQKATSEVKTSDNNCVIPSGCLSDLPKLKILTLPIWCSSIEDGAISYLPLLYEINLPKKLKSIDNAFKKCPQLKSVSFPSTLYYFGKKAFDGTNLGVIDLSKCDWMRFGNLGLPYRTYPTENKVIWMEGPKTNKLYLPKNIECLDALGVNDRGTVYCPATLEYCDAPIENITIYCKSSQPFKLASHGKVSKCTIYVPKGSTTPWYAKFGQDNTIKEYE